MTQDDASRFLPGQFLDSLPNMIADPAESQLLSVAVDLPLPEFFRTLGDNYIRKSGTAFFTCFYFPDHRLEGERDLGYQNNIGASGESGMQCDPTCIASHDLQDHHPIMRRRGRMQPIEGLGRDVDRRHETEG